MQKSLQLIGASFLLLLSFSCQTDILYSCDPQIEKWANNNLDEIHQMTRAGFIKLEDINYQRAAFAAFSPEQREAIWTAKLEEVLTLDWTDSEKQHIQSLQSLLLKNVSLFSEGFTDQQRDELHIAAYRWAEYAKDALGWDDKIIYAIAGNPNKMLTKNGLLEEKAQNVRTLKTRSIDETCECSTIYLHEEYMIIKDCKSGCYPSANCDKTTWRCGMFWGDPCNGLCY